MLTTREFVYCALWHATNVINACWVSPRNVQLDKPLCPAQCSLCGLVTFASEVANWINAGHLLCYCIDGDAAKPTHSDVFHANRQADKNMHEAVETARWNGKGVFLQWQDEASWSRADSFNSFPKTNLLTKSWRREAQCVLWPGPVSLGTVCLSDCFMYYLCRGSGPN